MRFASPRLAGRGKHARRVEVMAPKNRPKQPPAKPLASPYVPRYVSPKEKAETRVRWRRFFYWAAVVLPVLLTLMLFGYSDQAPAALRAATENFDAMFGYPVLRLIALIAS
jgi:hypothetical protein